MIFAQVEDNFQGRFSNKFFWIRNEFRKNDFSTKMFIFSIWCSSLFYFCWTRFLCCSTYQTDRNNPALNVELPANEKMQVSALNAFFNISVVMNSVNTSTLDALKHYHIIYLSITYSTHSITVIGETENSTDPDMFVFASWTKCHCHLNHLFLLLPSNDQWEARASRWYLSTTHVSRTNIYPSRWFLSQLCLQIYSHHYT
jgi:hypothetical protein